MHTTIAYLTKGEKSRDSQAEAAPPKNPPNTTTKTVTAPKTFMRVPQSDK